MDGKVRTWLPIRKTTFFVMNWIELFSDTRFRLDFEILLLIYVFETIKFEINLLQVLKFLALCE